MWTLPPIPKTAAPRGGSAKGPALSSWFDRSAPAALSARIRRRSALPHGDVDRRSACVRGPQDPASHLTVPLGQAVKEDSHRVCMSLGSSLGRSTEHDLPTAAILGKVIRECVASTGIDMSLERVRLGGPVVSAAAARPGRGRGPGQGGRQHGGRAPFRRDELLARRRGQDDQRLMQGAVY